MRFFLLLLIILSGTVFSCFAQTTTKPQLSIGADFGLPVGPTATYYGTAIGGSVKFELPLSGTRYFLTVTGGFNDYFAKLSYDGPTTDIVTMTFLPVQLGGKYYFSKIAYVELDAGVSFNINHPVAPTPSVVTFGEPQAGIAVINGPVGVSEPATAFIYAPIIGVTAPTNKHKAAIDLGLRYESRVESGGPVSQIALRLAYRFGL